MHFNSQDFLICIEMFIAALAHKYSFPHDPYHINIPDYNTDRTWYNALAAMIDISDVGQDVSDHLGVVGSSLSRRLRGRGAYHMARGISETDYLINSNTNSLSVPQTSYQGGAQSASNASTATLHSGKNRYGAFEHMKNDAIKIVKQTAVIKDYSPQYGVPRPAGNFFFNQEQASPSPTSFPNDPSSRSDNTSRSDTTMDGGRDRTMKKSDSTTSDWLSTPTDELMGIDVRGIEKDRINFKNNPRI